MGRLVLLWVNQLFAIADSKFSVTRRIVMLSVEGQGIVAVNNQFSRGRDNRPFKQMPTNYIAILISNGDMNMLVVWG
jgi:hypothetical protein